MKWSAAARRTTLTWGCCVLALMLVSAGPAMAQPGHISSSDTAIGIDLDATFGLNGRYPGPAGAGESPPRGIDGNVATKYLNFGAAGSGFIVSPAVSPATAVDGFQITTANDAPGRDPANWSLYGFNGALTTTDSGPSPAINQTGLAEAWTLIASGSVALPGDPAVGNSQRGVVGPMVAVNSTTPYQHYKFIVDAIKRPSDNIMQFAEIEFFSNDENPASGFLVATDPIIAVDAVGSWNGSSSPGSGNEDPRFALDQFYNPGPPEVTTKYLNFGEMNSGIIITNSEGPIDVNFMRLRTANDAVARDPASYRLEGTNDPITSVPNSNSNGTEVWTPIAEGTLSLPEARHTWDDEFIPINSPTAYSSYRLVFPTVKDAAAANSMQIADIQFYTVIPEPSTVALVAVMGMALAAATRRRS